MNILERQKIQFKSLQVTEDEIQQLNHFYYEEENDGKLYGKDRYIYWQKMLKKKSKEVYKNGVLYQLLKCNSDEPWLISDCYNNILSVQKAKQDRIKRFEFVPDHAKTYYKLDHFYATQKVHKAEVLPHEIKELLEYYKYDLSYLVGKTQSYEVKKSSISIYYYAERKEYWEKVMTMFKHFNAQFNN